jgi:hypothetical protein
LNIGGGNYKNNEDCIKSIAIHEFGHALGFAHQQERDNCNFYDCNYEKNRKGGDWFISACDTNSVMNYCCNPLYNNNGWQLSENDLEALYNLYGFPANENESKETYFSSTSEFIRKKVMTIGTM